MGEFASNRNAGPVMTELREAISIVRSRLKKHSNSRAMNEQNTKAILIEPILRAIGWDVEDLDSVVHEYRRKKQDNPVDYAMMILRTPKLFLEAKALHKNLDDAKWAKQTLGYATVAGVQWVVLSNGDEYKIYNSHAVVPIEKKLFRTIRISDPRSKAEEVLSLISREELQEKTIDLLWEAHFVDSQVKRVVTDLFQDDPSEGLIDLIRRSSDNLKTGEVNASLQRANVSIDYPEILKLPKAKTKSSKSTKRSGSPKGRKSVSLEDIVSQGLIKLPCKIFAKYKNVEVAATIEKSGRIIFRNAEFRSLSTAASAARKHVLGWNDSKRGPSTNGWVFWKTSDGKKLSELRELASKIGD